MQGIKLTLREDILRELYDKQKWSKLKIAQKLGCGQTSITRYLEKYNIPIRTFQDSIRISHALGRVQYQRASGVKSGAWNGGIRRDPRGYILVLDRKHPRAHKNGYVYEHIKVWEEHNGQSLPQGWCVHHINGIKYDNRPDNLVGLPNDGHNKFALLRDAKHKIVGLESENFALKNTLLLLMCLLYNKKFA